jgi:serine/threonine-protein kinase
MLQGRYRILERVAAGAMGVVYRAERIQLGRSVAVKFLHPWIAAQKAFLGRFENEARAMSRLGHPNCVSVIDFGVDVSPYLVMDFVTGTTLRQVMDTGRMPVERALRIVRQLLAGLAHAHAQDIIHRDLKPDNIIISDEAGLEDHLRILDFGLAKLRDGPAMTAGMAIGTPSYMSPEQTGTTGMIDGRTDIYAVGVVLFELLAGQKPYRSQHMGDLLLMHREAPVPTVGSVAPEAGISEQLEQVIARAMAKRPEDRFPTAAAFAQALDSVPEAQRPTGAATVGPPSAPAEPAQKVTPVETGAAGKLPQRRATQRRVAIVGVLLATAAVAALVTGAILRRGTASSTASAIAVPTRTAEPASRARAPAAPPAESPAGARSAGDPGVASDLQASALTAFSERRWADGIAAAEKAARVNPEMKTDPQLIRGVIQSLAGDKTLERSQAFLRGAGATATPVLRDAARHDPSPKVRERSADLLGAGARGSFARSSSSSFFKR